MTLEDENLEGQTQGNESDSDNADAGTDKSDSGFIRHGDQKPDDSEDKGSNTDSESGNDADAGGNSGEGKDDAPTLTQKQVDKIVSDRLKRAQKAYDKQVRDLKSYVEKLESAQKSKTNEGNTTEASGAGEASGTSEQKTAPLDPPQIEDFDTMEDYFAAVDLYADKDEPYDHLKKGAKKAETTSPEGKQSNIKNPFEDVELSESGLKALDIVQTTLDKHDSGVDYDAFIAMVNDNDVVLSESVFDFMAENNDNAIKVAQFLMENPIESKRIDRLSNHNRKSALASIVDGSYNQKSATNSASGNSDSPKKLTAPPVEGGDGTKKPPKPGSPESMEATRKRIAASMGY